MLEKSGRVERAGGRIGHGAGGVGPLGSQAGSLQCAVAPPRAHPAALHEAPQASSAALGHKALRCVPVP